MRLRPLGIMKVTALVVLLVLVVAVETDAAEPAILILTPTLPETDSPAALEAARALEASYDGDVRSNLRGLFDE